MHLMVLGTSRHSSFPFHPLYSRVSMRLMVLGASRHVLGNHDLAGRLVSMHLMVLGASRLDIPSGISSVSSMSQCT